jgi:hypothetical protein
LGALKPIVYTWDGEHMVPLRRLAKLCDEQFVVGERYRLEEGEQERSLKSHGHYFVVLAEYYRQLPEEFEAHFPTFEHFRKKLLIRAGFCDERSIVCSSEDQALAVAALVKAHDDYAIVGISGLVITVYTAKSQRMRAMGNRAFQESKTAVLDLAADMIGIPVEEMKKHAGRAA